MDLTALFKWSGDIGKAGLGVIAALIGSFGTIIIENPIGHTLAGVFGAMTAIGVGGYRAVIDPKANTSDPSTGTNITITK